MLAALTAMGLSAAAGLNAYIPFLIVALLAKFTDIIVLPASFSWMESWWAIGIGTILLIAEVTLDKIPAIDTVNDTIQTIIRPMMGGVIVADTPRRRCRHLAGCRPRCDHRARKRSAARWQGRARSRSLWS